MIARYYSAVSCHFNDTTREQLETWLDQCTGIGDTMGEPDLFDIDFSADLGKFQIGIHAAHRATGIGPGHPLYNAPLAVWSAASDAIGHAATMLAVIGAIGHLQTTQAAMTRGIGDNEQLLMNVMTAWRHGHPGATVTQDT